MNYRDKLKEELDDRIRHAEVIVESTQPVYTNKMLADVIGNKERKIETDYAFNLGVLIGLKQAKELFEEVEDELQR